MIVIGSSEKPQMTRLNEIGIQMLPTCIFNSIFKSKCKLNSQNIQFSKSVLKHSKLLGKTIPPINDINLKLPNLCGNDIISHFNSISKYQSMAHKNLALSLLDGYVNKPTTWSFSPGWTRYTDSSITQVQYPSDQAVF